MDNRKRENVTTSFTETTGSVVTRKLSTTCGRRKARIGPRGK